ncbi:MAG: M48 family metallopeptidase [Candidatus Marinimicrobia bacterium]|nr:M48 family metallopeptidase [Candidatus Neomarinimicrobiota bacterium]
MKRLIFILKISLLTILLSTCATVPITGRRQLAMVPQNTILEYSESNYREFLNENKIITSGTIVRMIKHVGENVTNAVIEYFTEQGKLSLLDGYNWEFNLVEKEDANAWCMPGGKVVVYTGILDITKHEGGLAVVMAHEIAHAIANHGNERMSQVLLAQMGGMALSTAMASRPQQTQDLWMQVFGMGANLGILLPYSRVHESEADRLGMVFMAKAGYDPDFALEFWQRMSDMKNGNVSEEILSTHPSDEHRIQEIRDLIPEVEEYYQNSVKQHVDF